MMSILLRVATALIASAALWFAIKAHSEVRCFDDSPCLELGDSGEFRVAQETLYQSYPGNNTAMLRGSRVIALMPLDTEIHHVDTSEGYPHLFPGSCIAAPPAKCVLRPEQVEPMQEAPTK